MMRVWTKVGFDILSKSAKDKDDNNPADKSTLLAYKKGHFTE